MSKEEGGVTDAYLRRLAPAVLAYIGDAVFELQVRKMLMLEGPSKINALHRRTVDIVNASQQAKIFHWLEENCLTEFEKDIARKGRNAKTGQVPRNADVLEYRFSTGLEALLGYLHLKGEQERVEELISWALKAEPD